MNDDLGKKAEAKIKEWLDRPDESYSITRLYDPMGGYYGVNNICDYICYKYPNVYYIESKATYNDRFDFNMIRPNQREGLCKVSCIQGCFGWVIVLFAAHKRAFKFNMTDLQILIDNDIKSLNIKKINTWNVAYKELRTIPSRKLLLDYAGNIEDLI